MEQLTAERREKIIRLRAKKETENRLRVNVVVALVYCITMSSVAIHCDASSSL